VVVDAVTYERGHNYILDADGNPQRCDDIDEWSRWFEANFRNRVVAHDKDESGKSEVLVSTVFLALDHNWGSQQRPILYETLVFGGPLDGEMNRYSTRDEALKGHQLMCERVAAAQPKPQE